MPKFRCHIPKKEGDEREAKKTKDGWDATFVFDGQTAPKGMVCKVIRTPVGKPKAVAVTEPEPVTATAAAAPVTETALAEPETSPSAPEAQSVATEAITVAQPQDPPPESLDAGFLAVAAVAAATTLALASSVGSGKGSGGGQGKSTRPPDARQQKEEKERRECGAQTEAVKADADSGLQRYDGVSATLNRLLEQLRSCPDDRDALDALQRSVDNLSKRIAFLEGHVKRKGSSKRDSGLRTDRSRPQKPAPRR